jgi:iron complex outermembrane receptor protein
MKHQLEVGLQVSLRKKLLIPTIVRSCILLVLKYDVTKNYNIKINASRNFRIPSFNDLYWQQGGNPDLDLKMRISTNWGKKFVFRPFDSRQLLLNKINI